MEDAAVLEPFELQYADLMLLSSLDRGSSSSSKEENKRLESITRTMMENLGPFGPGLLSITGVSKAYSLRHNLLPLASKLALLNDDNRKKILKVFLGRSISSLSRGLFFRLSFYYFILSNEVIRSRQSWIESV